jgi:hypothetical protein
MNHPGHDAQVVFSGGEPGGLLTIAKDHVLRRLAAAPWNAVRPLLESSPVAGDFADLVPWREIEADADWVVLRHPRVPVISYPHEWCGEMLQEAALTHCRLLSAVGGTGHGAEGRPPMERALRRRARGSSSTSVRSYRWRRLPDWTTCTVHGAVPAPRWKVRFSG